MPQCKIIQSGNDLLLSFPYDVDMVADIKATIPAGERRYDPQTKSWRIAANKAAKIQNLCSIYFNELPLIPSIVAAKPIIKSQIIEVRYIGATKDRGSDDRSAYGWVNDGWNVIFPEPVLRAYFDAPSSPDEQPTFYSVLSVQRGATDDEIKSGYRRMVRQWHPDVCREPNANEQFLAIQHAFDVLSKNRDRYDAGLAFEQSLRKEESANRSYDRLSDGYRTPLRCGVMMVEGIESVGVFNVSKIFAWEDIRNSAGQTLVVSWPTGAKKFIEDWS